MRFDPKADPPFAQLRLALGVLVVGCSLFALLLSRNLIFTTLANWTGEEDHWEQVKGLGALFLLRLTQGVPETAPYVPISHAGLNPFGINTFLEQEVEPAKVEHSLQMIAEAGFHWIRQEFPWEDIEISGKGDFWDHKWNKSAWEKYDRLVDAARRYGLEIIARLDNPPAWSRAAGDVVGTFAPPDRLEDFGDFVYTVVSRYRGRIRYYQIWNEPNIYPEWGERPVNAAEYVALLKVAYARAKEADPHCVILSAGLAQTTEPGPRNLDDTIYLQQMYDAGAKDYFDVMGVMAYGLWTGPGDRRASRDRTNFARPQLIRAIMVRNGDAGKAIWATEVGWNALPPDFAGLPMFGRVSEAQQARYAVQAYERAQREWPWMGVLNYWFFKRATDSETGQAFYYFRMVEPDFTPLPVYEAMRAYATSPPTVSIGYHQENHWALRYSGDWMDVADQRAVLGAYRRSQRPGDTLEFTFWGTDLDLVTIKGEASGSLRVRLDDGQPQVIALASPVETQHVTSLQYGVRIPLARGLRPGKHRVEITAEKGQAAVDGLLVRRGWTYEWRLMGGGLLLLGILTCIVYVISKKAPCS